VRIASVRIFRIDLPLATPFQHASSGVVTHLQEVVARVETEGGAVGWGEVRGNCTYVTGDTPDRVVAAASFLAPSLVGESLEELPRLADRMGNAIVGNSASRAVLDIAMHDALARVLGVPVALLLGGFRRATLPTDTCVAFCSAPDAAERTRTALAEGYTLVKLRVGLTPDEDEARCDAVRTALSESGRHVLLAADANGAWTPKQALAAIRRLEPYGLAFIEQPVPGDDIEGLCFVREHCGVPVMADESATSARAILDLIERHAADMFHFKLIKAGGFVPLRRMTGMAEAAGLPYMIGQMDEGMLATAAAVHAGAASAASYFEVHCDQGVVSQPFRGLIFQDGCMVLPAGPGLGVEVDERELACVASFP
jgi:L-Ala-D/L-Glu epimerase